MADLNEAKTRRELIDPALQKAGWDVGKPEQVGTEIPVDGFDPLAWQALAAELNRLREALKRLEIGAERQWNLKIGKHWYFLDFAVFCNKGQIDIETDGDRWHADRERIPEDNRRNNALEAAGWRVLRFNGQQIRETLTEYCVPKITQTINRLDGLSDEGLVSRVFHETPEGLAQQLTLFEERVDYEGE